MTFCIRGGQVSDGACVESESKKRAEPPIETSDPVMRMQILGRFNYARRAKHHDSHNSDCGPVAEIRVDGILSWKSSQSANFLRSGSIDAMAVVDVEPGTHTIVLHIRPFHCRDIELLISDLFIEGFPLRAVPKVQFRNQALLLDTDDDDSESDSN
jgi:hypothetical protein